MLRHTHPMPALLATLLCLAAFAAQPPAPAGQPDQGQARHRMPPPEAYEACDGKKAGDRVTFTTPRGEKMSGTCTLIPARLAAAPDHPPGGPAGQGNQGGNPPPRPN